MMDVAIANWVSAAVGTLSLVIAIAQLRQSKKDDFSGQFFTFQLEKYRKSDIAFSYAIVACAVAMMSVFVFCLIGRHFGEILGISNPQDVLLVVECVLWASVISITILNQFVVYSDFRWLDDWLKDSEFGDYLFCAVMPSLVVAGAILGIIHWFNPAFTSDLGYIVLLVMIAASIPAVLLSFLRKYIALRKFFAISNTKITINEGRKEYSGIQNFRIAKGNLILICGDERKSSKVIINESSNLVIEQTIDTGYSLKDYLETLRGKAPKSSGDEGKATDQKS